MADYAKLESEIARLKKAAVRAYMLVDHDMDTGSCDEGRFEGLPRSILVSTSPPGGYIISYPDGGWTSVYDGSYAHPQIDFKQLWSDIDVLVESALNRLRDIPDGDLVGDQAEALGIVATMLSAGGPTIDGEGDESTISVGNDELQVYVDYVDDELAQYNGNTIEMFDTNYASRVAPVLAGQSVLASMLSVLASGQGEVFENARQDVADFVSGAATAFDTLATNKQHEKRAQQMKLVTLVLNIAGLVTTGKLASTVGKISGIKGIAESFAAPPETSAKELILEGSTGSEMMSSLNSEATTLSDTIFEAEKTFWNTGQRCLDSISDHPSAYNIAEPTDLLTETDRGQLFADGENLHVLVPHLKEIAVRFELIGDIQATQAAALRGALDIAPWTRPLWIGIGSDGFHEKYLEVGQALADRLENSAQEMSSVSARLVLVGHDFQATEDQIEAELRRKTQQVRRQTLDELNRAGD